MPTAGFANSKSGAPNRYAQSGSHQFNHCSSTSMADFKTHVTFSSAIGAGYAVIGTGLGFELSTSLVAGGLCGVAGMLPDVDSDSGVPRREALGFAAAIVPMLLIDRFRQFELTHDQMVLVAAALYFGIRFTLADLIGRWSVHRGMWHSIPAILIFAGLAFLISGPAEGSVFVRYFKAIAVGIGSFSHLILDEVYSVDTRGVVPKFKKSFGTAVKFWGKNPTANFSTYGKLAIVIVAILMEPAVIDRLELRNPEFANKVRNAKERLAQIPSSVDAINSHRTPSNQSPFPEQTPAPMQAINDSVHAIHESFQKDAVKEGSATNDKSPWTLPQDQQRYQAQPLPSNQHRPHPFWTNPQSSSSQNFVPNHGGQMQQQRSQPVQNFQQQPGYYQGR